ncbi:GNAT family N-acetyltransferase [Rossellomorea aquimaris]|nr:GNAT family protein [Rossellomorea aquimaris]
MDNRSLSVETARLIVRPFMKSDYHNWLHENMNKLPSQHKYDIGLQDMSECTEFWFHNMIDQQNVMMNSDEVYIFGVFLKQTGAYIGSVDFSTLMRLNFHWGRVGYTLNNTHWRRGYGKEAVRGALKIAFEKLNYHRVEAHINLDNTPSIKLAEGIGMKYECTRKGFINENGKWTDNHVFYMNAEDYY